LNSEIGRRYESMGAERVHAFFPSDHTHTNEAGAQFTAQAVVAVLKDAQSPLAGFLAK
jgi:lysophospholipase L1-like esterase